MMNELKKTGIFAGVALLTALIAWAATSSWFAPRPETEVGEQLCPEYTDPAEAASLEIVVYNEETASRKTFELARSGDVWVLPSYDNYPADKEGQVGEALASLLDVKILGTVSDNVGDRELYGVVDPAAEETVEQLKTGVGTRVTMKDADRNALLDLIIGKEVKGDRADEALAEAPTEEPPELHYVRRADQDRIYTVAISTEKLKTNFDNWINDDLLHLDGSWKVDQLTLRDDDFKSRTVLTPQGPALSVLQQPQSEIVLDDDAGWKMTACRRFDKEDAWYPLQLTAEEKAEQDGLWADVAMAEDEELDTEKARGIASALDSLTLVRVVPKPEGLSEKLKAGEKIDLDEEVFLSLHDHGFYPSIIVDDPTVLGEGGGVRCLTEDGVEYVLRFGLAIEEVSAGKATDEDADGAETKDAEAEAAKAEAKDGKAEGAASEETASEGKDGSGEDAKKPKAVKTRRLRYLFVTAHFNDKGIRPADIQPVPEITEGPEAKQKPAEPKTKPEGEVQAKGEAQPEPEPKDKPETPAETPKAKPAPAEKTSAAEGASEASAAEDAETSADTADDPPAPTDEPPTPPDEAAPAEDVAEPATEPTGDPSEPAETETPEPKTVTKEDRDRVIKRNEEERERFDKDLKEGQEQVEKLNARFADWYYLIAEEDYEKILLSRDELVKKKEKPEEKEESKPPVPGEGEPEAKPEPSPKAEPQPEPKEEPAPKAEPTEKPAPKAEPAAKPEPAPETKPEIKAEATPESKADAGPKPERPNPLRTDAKEGQKP